MRDLAVVAVALADVSVELEQRLAAFDDHLQRAVPVLVLDVTGVAVLTFGQMLIGIEDGIVGERLVLQVLRRGFLCCRICFGFQLLLLHVLAPSTGRRTPLTNDAAGDSR